MKNTRYQPEVDGLRAVAILPVIVFHANESWLPGGFVGVDIFFVISGYLIATILMHNSAMSSREFLAKRVKRILPAYLAMLLVVLAAGAVLMSSKGLYHIAKASAAALFQVTNIASLSKAPYFSLFSLEKPLLHTWSLAVEWQFYLLVSFLLYVFHKGVQAKYLSAVLAILGGASFIASVYFAIHEEWASHAYYNFVSRFWEFMFGVLAAWLCFSGEKRFARLASFSGAVAVLLSLLMINNERAFPGFWALMPVLGAAGMIYGSQQENLIKQALSTPVLVYCGKLSYSLYLWHWPVFALLRYVTASRELSSIQVMSCLPIILLLSLVSYYFVETMAKKETVYKYIKTACVIIFLICLVLVLTRGGGRFAEKDAELLESQIECVTEGVAGCGDVTSNTKILLIGDSHAGHWSAAFDELSKEMSWHLSILSVGACAPVLTESADYYVPVERGKMSCEAQRNLLNESVNKYDKVFIVGRWESYFQKPDFNSIFKNTLTTLLKGDATLYVLEQLPSFVHDGARLNFLNNRFGISLPVSSDVSESSIEGSGVVKSIVEQLIGIHYVETAKGFCKDDACSQYLHGDYAYIDNNHVNIKASRVLAEVLRVGIQ